MPRPFTRLDHPSALVRHFIPGWFAVTMGTGVLALVLGNLPGPLVALSPLGEVVWALDLVLFLAFSLLFIGRLVAFPETIGPMLAHPVQSMFLGAIPMGLATLINGLVLYGGPRWGGSAYALAHGLWWLDMLLALGSALLVPYLMFTHQRHALESLTAVWLLPIVAPEVAAASAGVLAPHLAPELARPLLVSGYLLWGLSLTLAFSLITLVLLRLALHKLPDTAFAATSWLPLGPLATGCLGLMTLGHAAPVAFAGTPLEGLGSLAPAAGLMGAFVLWGAGFWWLVIALLFTLHYRRQRMAFNLGWWGFTFPLGVFALASLELQRQTDMVAFGGFGLLLAAGLALVWGLVMRRTLAGLWHGELFRAPCLSSPA